MPADACGRPPCWPRRRPPQFVVGPPHVCFYCGAPLVSSDGFIYGSLAVLDVKPRTIHAETANLLACFGELVALQLEKGREWPPDTGLRCMPDAGLRGARPAAGTSCTPGPVQVEQLKRREAEAAQGQRMHTGALYAACVAWLSRQTLELATKVPAGLPSRPPAAQCARCRAWRRGCCCATSASPAGLCCT